MSVGVVFVSYWTNLNTVKQVIHLIEENKVETSILDDILSLNYRNLMDPFGCAFVVIQNFLIQSILSFVFSNIHLGPRYPVIQKLLPISFLTPSLLATLPLPAAILNHSPVFAALLPLSLVKFVLWASVVSVSNKILFRILFFFKHKDNI